MPTFKKCDETVIDLAEEILTTFETHKPVLDADVKIDYLWAYGDVDENGETVGNALTKNGVKALGITRKLSLKDRAKGLGDAEIVLDGDYWGEASPEEQRALLDHELHHISVSTGKRDDLGRPVIKLRKHDLEVGFFAVIAQRHGVHSMERQQAKRAMDLFGQYFWPEMVEAMGQNRFASIAETQPQMQKLLKNDPGWVGAAIEEADAEKRDYDKRVQESLKKTPEFKALAEAVRKGELTIETTKPN